MDAATINEKKVFFIFIKILCNTLYSCIQLQNVSLSISCLNDFLHLLDYFSVHFKLEAEHVFVRAWRHSVCRVHKFVQ